MFEKKWGSRKSFFTQKTCEEWFFINFFILASFIFMQLNHLDLVRNFFSFCNILMILWILNKHFNWLNSLNLNHNLLVFQRISKILNLIWCQGTVPIFQLFSRLKLYISWKLILTSSQDDHILIHIYPHQLLTHTCMYILRNVRSSLEGTKKKVIEFNDRNKSKCDMNFPF